MEELLRHKIRQLQGSGDEFENSLVSFIVSLLADPNILTNIKTEIIAEKEKSKTALMSKTAQLDSELADLKGINLIK